MTKRLPATPGPGTLEDYAARLDDLFGTLAQRQAFRRYLEGLLQPAEPNKTLTALVHLQYRFRVVSYSSSHETSDIRTYALKGRARAA